MNLPRVDTFSPLAKVTLPITDGLSALQAFAGAPNSVITGITTLPPLGPLAKTGTGAPNLRGVLITRRTIRTTHGGSTNTLTDLIIGTTGSRSRPNN